MYMIIIELPLSALEIMALLLARFFLIWFMVFFFSFFAWILMCCCWELCCLYNHSILCATWFI
jgi:hypothetical protein